MIRMTNNTPTTEPIDLVLSKLQKVKEIKTGRQWKACCPAHDDTSPSLDIGLGRDNEVLLHCKSGGCTSSSVAAALGLTMGDLFTPKTSYKPARAKPEPPKLCSESFNPVPRGYRRASMYDYVKADGELLYQVVKYEHDSKKKEFRQRRPIEGKWAWSLNGTQRILYRLPHLLEASDDSFVFVVEGEKDADRLIDEGVFATTTSGGAGNSNKTDLGPLSDRPVILVPDNDDAGRKHMKDLASQLHGVAESVRILNLPELPSKGDVSDWLDQGHDTEELLTLADLVIVEAPAPVPEKPGLYILDDVAPMRLAEDFTKRKLLHEDGDLLWRLHRGDWWRYGDTTGHIVLPKELMRGGIRAYLDRVRHDKINKKTGERELKPMLVNKRLV